MVPVERYCVSCDFILILANLLAQTCLLIVFSKGTFPEVIVLVRSGIA
jgi:hypothetical protein